MATIKHADFTVEQHDYIVKNIEVVNKRESFWSKFCEHDTMPKADKLRYRRQVLLDPTLAADTLAEGVTPDSKSLKVIEFSVTHSNIGSWIEYTRENEENLDSVTDMASEQLAHERLFDLETIRANAFIGTTATVSMLAGETTYEPFLLRIKTLLNKNKGKFVEGGNYVCVAPGEILNKIVAELGTKLAAVPAGEEIILKGAIGRSCGFIFHECNDATMYDATSGAPIALFVARNENGRLPVVERSFAGTNSEVYSKTPHDASKDDPLGQKGFVASRIDGVSATLTDPFSVLKWVSSESAYDAMLDYATATDAELGAVASSTVGSN